MDLTRVDTAIRIVKVFLGYNDSIRIEHDNPDQIRVLIQSASRLPDHNNQFQVSLGILDRHLKTLRLNPASTLPKKGSSPLILKRRMLELEHAAKIWPMPRFYIHFEKEAVDKLVEELRPSTTPPSNPSSGVTLDTLMTKIDACEKVKLCLGVHLMKFKDDTLKKIHYAHRWNQRTGIWTNTLASELKQAILDLDSNLCLNHFTQEASNTVEEEYKKVHTFMKNVSDYQKDIYGLNTNMPGEKNNKENVKKVNQIVKDKLDTAMVVIYKLMYLESYRSNAISFST